MIEGWFSDEYLVLFSDEERTSVCAKYRLSQYLSGYTLVGLRSWDDFIVMNTAGAIFSLPTVPLDPARVAPFVLPENVAPEQDARFTRKIKWYLKPLVFGCDANDKGNLAWVGFEQHADLVVWWNYQYKTLKAQDQNV
jgi:hypothetical protein